MTDDATFWLLAGLAAFFVGAAKGGLPMVGMIAVPLLALRIPVVSAAGLLLPIYIVSDMYGLWFYRHQFSIRNIMILVPAAAAGIGVGWATASITPEAVVTCLVGLMGLVFTCLFFLRRGALPPARTADVPRGSFWGFVAGFTSFVSHSGAPPFQIYVLPQRLPKLVYAGTATIVFALINLLKLPPYWFLGQVNGASLHKVLYLVPVALAGTYCGYRLTRLLPEKLFYTLVQAALFLLSCKLIYDSFAA